MGKKTALIAGSTGLIGNELTKLLLKDDYYGKVKVAGRNNPGIEHPKLESIIINFDSLPDYKEQLLANDVFCCLGTTMKKAKSREAFYKVDYTFPFELAKVAESFSAEQFLLVTAMGASKNSRIYYNSVKGQVEESISAMEFESIHIFRPSLLLGKRQELRLGESIGQIIARLIDPVMVGPLNKYRAVKASAVANAMLSIAKAGEKGVYYYENDQILAF